jgi:predicted Zn-dependent peptidase
VRERLGLAYAIDSAVDLFADSGCLTIYAGCSSDEAGRVVELILRELARVRQRGIAADELERAKEHLKGSLALAQESTSSRMSNLARQEISYGKLSTLAEAFRAIERTDRRELLELAQEYLSPEQIALTALADQAGRPLQLPSP